MHFNELLSNQSIDPRRVVVLRHRPTEPPLRRALPWLAADKPEVFNSYQRCHGPQVEAALLKLRGLGFVASFIGIDPGEATFVGLYAIDAKFDLLSYDQWHAIADHQQLHQLGDRGPSRDRGDLVRFGLTRHEFYQHWTGRLVVSWPGGERSWWRRAERNRFETLAIHRDNAFDRCMPEWRNLDLGWHELQAIPSSWQAAISQWRGVYLIRDMSDGMMYVGSACGHENLLGRWRDYASKSDGGNKRLRGRRPNAFRFTVLQRVSPDADVSEVVRVEQSWKNRLHTAHPNGLNEN